MEVLAVSESTLLDNPIWWALDSHHQHLGQRWGMAARYPASVSRLAGLAVATSEAFSDLEALVQPGERVTLFTAEPPKPPPQWQVLQARQLEQMVCELLLVNRPPPAPVLGEADVPDMLALVAITDPGPFLPGTIQMGRYVGFRSADDNILMAMAGERLRLDQFTEISAVCTSSAHRGHGYAGALVAGLAAYALDSGSAPFLHVKTENGAKILYDALGFRVRRSIHLTAIAFTG
jgi:ribosomal protein S18 acetylase RimI-like enzyme